VAGSPSARRRPALSGWRRVGESLVRELEFRDFDQAVEFVDRIAASATDHLRRPDICIVGFNRVRLTIANPNRSGITAAELRLAERVNAVIGG
jgi:4a-hydroxytetrahydrobiopterin dehydratase